MPQIPKPIQADWQLHESDTIPRIAIWVTKQDHCMLDLLWRVQAQEIKTEIPLIISNHSNLEHIFYRYNSVITGNYIIPMKKKQRQGKLKIDLLVRVVILMSPLGLYWLLARLQYIPSLFEIPKILSLNNSPKQKQLHIAIANNQLLNYDRQIKDIISTIDKSQTSILIEKSKYKLTLYHQGTPIKSYPVVFGANPVGDKLKEGDKRTPEGIFQIRDLYPHNSWSKFIWLDYPNKDSWRKYLQAKKEGKINWFDSIGSEIGIHGVPNGADYLIDEQRNWTWGCISLNTQDIDELYQVVQTGTKVEIRP